MIYSNENQQFYSNLIKKLQSLSVPFESSCPICLLGIVYQIH